MEGYQPFTTDADVVLDPGLLADIPPLGEAMTDAGFVLTDEPGTWEARFQRAGFDEEIVVPVDLIVPEELGVGDRCCQSSSRIDRSSRPRRRPQPRRGVRP